MGSYNSTYRQEPTISSNRIPIITPRHVPPSIDFKDTPYSKFDPELYKDKFAYPLKEEPKYW